MARKYNTIHIRNTSGYTMKTTGRDRYGLYDNGTQKSADRIAGRNSWHRDHNEKEAK